MNATPQGFGLLNGFAVLCILLWSAAGARGALRTWDGGGADNYWANAANWALDVAPVAGDDLLFPGGAARLFNSNNFAPGTVFNSITLAGGGYSLNGLLMGLSGGVTNLAGVSSLYLPITLGANQSFAATDGALLLQGDIDTAGRTLDFAVSGTAEIQIVKPVSGTGGITKSGSSLLTIGANNSFLGTAAILEGTVVLAHTNALGLTLAGTTLSAGATIGLSGTITVPEPLTLQGRLRGSTTGTNATWSGPITLVSNSAAIEVQEALPLTISGLISGTGSLTKVSSGILRLTANNTHTGTTTNQLGTLIVDGQQPSSEVVIGLGATLTGNGRVGNVGCAEGITGFIPRIIPGQLGIGRLTISSLTMSSVANLSVQLNGTVPGTSHGQVKVNGSLNVTNAGLNITLVPGFVPPLGSSYVLIDNDGSDPTLGEFRFLSQGTIFNAGGYPFQISYNGGTGNDVVLTRVGSVTGFESVTVLTGGSIFLQGTGGVNSLTYTIQATTNLAPPLVWSNIGFAQANFNGRFGFSDNNAPLFPLRFYRAVSP